METVNRIMLFLYYGVWNIDAYINKFSKENSNVFFIQVGSNDGRSGDPIFNYVLRDKWKGVLIEPLKYVFEALKHNYRESNELIFVNAALSHEEGEKEIFKIEERDDLMKKGFHQLASFNKSVILKHSHIIDNLEQLVVAEKVRTITFENIIDEYKITDVSVIHIDTEGYDFEVLKLFNFKKFQPRMVLFENKHLSETDNIEANKLLRNFGYRLFSIEGDTLATLKN